MVYSKQPKLWLMQKLKAVFFFIDIIILVTSVQSNIQIQKFKRLHVCGLEGLVKQNNFSFWIWLSFS